MTRLFEVKLLLPGLLIVATFFLFSSSAYTAPFDLVLEGGRVIDPESGLDAVRSIGIKNGKIEKISRHELKAKRTVNVSGLVVSPGFIDLHAHGQNNIANDFQARDGVTTALELELGVYPVGKWYTSRKDKAIINYGATVSHSISRALALHEVPPDHELDLFKDALAPGISRKELDGAALLRMTDILNQGVADGGLGIGVGLAYVPGARRKEIFHLYQAAKSNSVPVFVHARVTSVVEPDSTSALQELIANSAATGAATHVCHIGSVGGVQVPTMLKMIDGARKNGVDISTEVYPYTAAHTFIGAAIFAGDWRKNIGMDYHDLQWTLSGERLTEDTFNKYRKEKPEGMVIAYFMPEHIVATAISHPAVMIASDGGRWENNVGHPRGAGTFARVLGRYVREQKLLSLQEALAKMTILPALRLQSYTPMMLNKGRIKKGADADITVFDPLTIIDNASFEKPMQYSKGIHHVLVNGEFVVRDGESVRNTFPGKAIQNGK
jgi:amidohydrolase family protein